MSEFSIGGYLIKRLQDYGIGDVFGVPGDYVLSFYELLSASPINVIGCTREDSAGFAADAYARLNGMGAVCVTYCVGGLSVCNSIAGAFAEKSPVVMITGSPGLGERVNNPLLHHKVREFSTQKEVFEKLCIAGSELSDPLSAFSEIDRVLDAAARFKRPVYLEIPRDMVSVVPVTAHVYNPVEVTSDEDALVESISEVVRLLENAKKPVIVAGVEIHRFGLQDSVLTLAEACQIPIASTLLSKTVIRETHPLYLGLYEGAMGLDEITSFVEDSDCVLLLGTFMTDLNLGIFTANLDPSVCISATSEQLRIRHHHYHNVQLGDFIRKLADARPTVTKREFVSANSRSRDDYQLDADKPITIESLIGRLNQQMDESAIVIADIGDSLFAGTELDTIERTDFISPAYYTSMGFSVPAALGAQIARPDQRPLVLVGDGAFQMTGMELSTIIRRGLSPIVLVLDNGGYGTERYLHPGDWDYNEINGWQYSKLPEILGGGNGVEVWTQGDFDSAISAAWEDKEQTHLLHIHLEKNDASETLKRLAEKLGKIV